MILTSLGHDRGKAVGREILELINVQTKVHPVVFRDVAPAHSGRLELHHKDHAQQLGVQVTSSTLGQVYQQDFLVVHDLTQIEGTLVLTDDITHHLVAQEGTKLTDEPGRDLTRFVRALRSWELLGPEVEHRLVGDVLEFLS